MTADSFHRRQVITLAALGCALFGGCAANSVLSPAASSSATSTDPALGVPSSGPTAGVGPALKTTHRLADLGVELAPPGPAQPALTADQAAARCGTECPATPPRVQLARATTLSAGEMAGPAPTASVTPLAQERLSYALSWEGVPCSPTGGLVNGSPHTPQALRCSVLTLVDAASGDVFFSAWASTESTAQLADG